MTLVLLAVTAVLSAPADVSAKDASAADVERMQGDWMVSLMKVGGTKAPDEQAHALFRTVEGHQYTVSRYSKVISAGKFQLDATQTPRTIDSTPENAADGKPLLGIYEFDGEKLKICNARPGKPRPKTFDAGKLSGHTLFVWEPEKP